MRVLVLHNFYRSSRPSGENAAVERDVALLTAAGHQVVLARKDSDEVLSGGAAGTIRAAASAVYSIGSRREARDLAERTGADVAHLHNLYPLWSPAALDGLRDAGVPVVQVLHNYRLSCIAASHMLHGSPCTRCLGLRVPLAGAVHRCYGSTAGSAAMTLSHTVNASRLLGADHYLAVSGTVLRRAVEHGVPEDRISVRPEFVEPLAPAAASPGLLPYLAFAGRLDANKGVRLLVDAFRSYRAAGGTLELRIAGSGPLLDELLALAPQVPHLHVLGRLAPSDARTLMAGARAVVSPALWEEPFGLTVLEAWREERPVIVTDLGGPAELVDASTGWVVGPDRDDLTAAFHEAEDADEADRRGRRGAAAVRTEYAGARTLAAYRAAWARIGLADGGGGGVRPAM